MLGTGRVAEAGLGFRGGDVHPPVCPVTNCGCLLRAMRSPG